VSGPRSLLRVASAHLSRDEAKALCDRVLGFATADDVRVNVSSGTSANTRFAVNQISTAGDNRNVSITVRAVFGRKAGSATTNRVDDAALRSVVERAQALARLAPDDPEMLPELGPQSYAEAGGFASTTATLDPGGRAAAVRAITDPAADAGLVSTGYLEANAGSVAVATSRGLFAWREETAVALTTTVRTSDGTGSGWAGATSHDVTRIDAAALGARAIEKARRSVNPVAIEPGRYTVVLEPTAVGNLVQLIAGAAQARAADEGRSFFSKPGGGTKIGMKVVDERVTLLSDPLDPEAYGATFGGDGLPSRKLTWIENGVVKNLAYDRWWAQQQGAEASAFPGSLRMLGGTTSLDEMIASTERGLLVTRFWYIRPVDPRTILYTGLTRDGTFLIENGRVTRAVKNLRWNESPIFMLNNVDAMGVPVRVSASESGGPGQAVVMPPLKVRDFTFTSLSDAV
jgi:predicted Zn-dependent protease